MLPGPTIIRKCSLCGGLLREGTLASANNFGQCFWTDGRPDAPMFREPPELVKCPHCGKLVWVSEQERVGMVPPFWAGESDPETGHAIEDPEAHRFRSARDALTPELEDYWAYLRAGVRNRAKARHARLRAWWEVNDVRGDPKRPIPRFDPQSDDPLTTHRAWVWSLDPSATDYEKNMRSANMRITAKTPRPLNRREAANLRALIRLLDEDDEEDRLLMVEAFRELDRFDEAETLLEMPFKYKDKQRVATLRRLIRQRCPDVKEICYRNR